MKCIANILTDGIVENDGLYNVVKDKDLLIPGLPTLIIGFTKMRSIYPNASIIEWKIDDDTFWTWGNRERRQVLEKDLIRFRRLAIKRFIKSLKYVFLSVLTVSKDVFDKFIGSLSDERKKAIFSSNDMVYIYYEGNNNIIGISLVDMDYMGLDRKILFRALYSGTNNVFIKNQEEIPFKIRNEFKNEAYVLPYLYSE
jgi:hypothetical protein